MANFPGGSPWAMARDICAGHILVSERTFRAFLPPQLDKIGFELERMMRQVRGEQPPLDDQKALQDRQRKLQRLRSAKTILGNCRRRMRR